jgi:hypothetical protein
MALDPVVNFFRSNIATLPLNSGTTTLVVASGDGNKLPDPAVDGAFNLVVYNAADPFATPEIVRCTARSSDTLTILRAQEGSSDTTKAAGLTWTVELVPTAKMINDIDTAIQAVTPVEVVNNLTSTDTDKALSAAQGKVLQDGKEPADATILKEADIVDNLTSTSITAPLSANQGKALEDTKVAKSGDTMTGTLTATKLIPSGDVVTGNGMYLPATNTVALSTDGTERLRIGATGAITSASTLSATKLIPTGDVASGNGMYLPTTNTVALSTNGGERMRITATGDVGIGTNSPNSSFLLHVNSNTEYKGVLISGSTHQTIQINSTSSNFQCLIEYKSASRHYVTGLNTDNTYFIRDQTATSDRIVITSAGVVRPGVDNTQTLGSASFRWSEVFAGNATINTSDANEKSEIAQLNVAEKLVARELKGLIRKYKWTDSINAKGEKARIHVGIMAQDVKNAFESKGLDAEQYGVYCKDTWYTKKVDVADGNRFSVTTVECEADDPDATEHVQYGVRYNELFSFIISAL